VDLFLEWVVNVPLLLLSSEPSHGNFSVEKEKMEGWPPPHREAVGAIFFKENI
jgi:hypothetical protein